MQERVEREIRMLRAMRRALETGLRKRLTGHEGGNAGHRQGVPFESPRQCSTLPATRKVLRQRNLLNYRVTISSCSLILLLCRIPIRTFSFCVAEQNDILLDKAWLRVY